MLLQDRDERGGSAEGVGDHALIGAGTDGGPQLTTDFGDEGAISQRTL